jgi:hypothetical protein
MPAGPRPGITAPPLDLPSTLPCFYDELGTLQPEDVGAIETPDGVI